MKENSNDKGDGLRKNSGKIRYDLVPSFAQEQFAGVLTKGAEKYAPRNWERGMNWTTVLASMMRHVEAFKRGEDYDPETGLLHTAHIMCNAAFLTEYYKIFPQGDDRPVGLIKRPRVGLDIDEVLADWVSHWMKHFNIKERPGFWRFDPSIGEKFEMMKDNKEFWLSIPPLLSSKELPFEPHCYITSRCIPTEWTMEWLVKNGFPSCKVITVSEASEKIKVAKDEKIDIFVDDRYDTFVEMNNSGIFCYLYTARHNEKYEVGHRRINSLKEIKL